VTTKLQADISYMSLKMIQDSSHITNDERKVIGYTKLTKYSG